MKALMRLGHEVLVYNPYDQFPSQLERYVLSIFHYRSGYRYMQNRVKEWLDLLFLSMDNVDLIWIDSGELFGLRSIRKLKELNVRLVLFNHDDPTGSRDGHRFDSLKEALAEYDLVTAVRDETEQDLLKLCNGRVLRVWRTYDEVAHSSVLTSNTNNLFASDVCFIGTWMRGENRDLFIINLLEKGLNISIWGDRWKKSPYWKKLKKSWKGPSLSGEKYVKAIQGSKICLGLLSKGNRDLHTTRTMEIPYAGGLLCAERTTEHLQLYRENKEAVFWDNVSECAEKCLWLLDNPEQREAIRKAGMKRVLKNKVGNEDICNQILFEVGNL
ncbi:MAG: glycosyltransferase [Colwellia sp.]|nr:glycosyltransferase [Colwellia sp.]